MEETVEKYMKDNMEKNATVWNKVQSKFECCGIHNASDWKREKLPDACCLSPTNGCSLNNTVSYYKDGCLDKFTTWVEDHIYYVGAVGIAFAFLQVIQRFLSRSPQIRELHL